MSVAMVIWIFIIGEVTWLYFETKLDLICRSALAKLGVLLRTHGAQLSGKDIFKNSILPVYFRIMAISIAGIVALM